jgi:hypothetical protein
MPWGAERLGLFGAQGNEGFRSAGHSISCALISLDLIPVLKAMKHREPLTLKKQLGDLLNSFKDDLSVAVIGTSYVDHCLASLLQHRLVKGDTSVGLLQPGKPGEYMARARLAYSLGLIQRSIFHNAERIGVIRDKFAYGPFDVSFADREVKLLCNNLNMHGQDVSGARNQFVHAVMMTSMEILMLAFEVEHA